MCRYDAILGNGDVQLVTLAAIAASIIFWMQVYKRFGVDLIRYALPMALWIAFGTLDITITARGTVLNPACEGNPLARAIFITFGSYGTVLASVLWISFWAGLVFLLNKKLKDAEFVSLGVFYGLAIGHLFGFSSWFGPLCWLRQMENWLPSGLAILMPACVLAGGHFTVAKALGSKKAK